MFVNLRGGSALTVVCAATLREKLQIKLSISPSHSILTQDKAGYDFTQVEKRNGRRRKKSARIEGIYQREGKRRGGRGGRGGGGKGRGLGTGSEG